MMKVLSPQIASLSEQYPMDDATLRAASPEYNKRIDHLSNELLIHKRQSENPGDD
jgi:hypothetical protein